MELINVFVSKRRVGSNDLSGMLNETPRGNGGTMRSLVNILIGRE